MPNADLVTVAMALARSQNFMERYNQGRTSTEEASELFEMTTQAIAALRRMAGTPVRVMYSITPGNPVIEQ